MSDVEAVSFLMPMYNPGVQLLEESVRSVLTQLPVNGELVVQDGGSTDGSLEWLEALDDARIKVESVKDHGQSDALNRALARASNPWIAWINADDIASPRSIAAFEGAQSPDADVIYGNYATIDSSSRRIRSFAPGRIDLRVLLYGLRLPFSGALYVRREYLVDLGAFDDTLHYCMDYDLYLRMWSGAPHARYVPVDMGALRLHPGTKTDSSPWGFVREAAAVRRRVVRTVPGRLGIGYATGLHSAMVLTAGLRRTRLYRKLRGRI